MKNKSNSSEHESARDFANRVGLKFQDHLLLSRALTHRSYLNEHTDAIEDNERLEFLGDAVLDFLVADWLYNQYPEMPEGDLTRMRSALVSTEQLAEFALEVTLGDAMKLGKGERQNGGNKRPQLLCDTFEALIGALYLDAGLGEVKDFIYPFLIDTSEDILANHKIEDPKSKFQEWAQAKGLETPKYITRKATGPEHSKVFEVDVIIDNKVYGNGKGSSKQVAAKHAAQMALEHLGID